MPVFQDVGFDNICYKKEIVKVIEVCFKGIKPILNTEEAKDNVNFVIEEVPRSEQLRLMVMAISQLYCLALLPQNTLARIKIETISMSELRSSSVTFLNPIRATSHSKYLESHPNKHLYSKDFAPNSSIL